MFFSVIVPVYNAKEYLKDCVDSILGQSYCNFELILVDDGSTDGSGFICDEYAKADRRIVVIHQNNAGLPGARQAGILQASGDYVLNVDADDWIAPEYLETAENQLENCAADVLSYPRVCVWSDGRRKTEFDPVPPGFYDKADVEHIIYPYLLQSAEMKNMITSIAGKIVRRELLYKNQMAVPRELELAEDIACTIGLYLGGGAVYIMDNEVYFYRIHAGSSSHRFRMTQYSQIAAAIRHFERINHLAIRDVEEQIDRYTLTTMLYLMLSAIESGAGKSLPIIRKTMKSPVFNQRIKRAKFSRLTAKNRIIFYLYKKELFGTAWVFLTCCRGIKRGLEKWRVRFR